MNASRHWLRAAARTARRRDHGELHSGPGVRRRGPRHRVGGCAARPPPTMQTYAVGEGSRVDRRRIAPRRSASTPTLQLAQLTRDDRRRIDARARRVAAADHGHARLQLCRSDGGRRGARRDRSVDDGIARLSGLVSWWARCSTWTAASAASTFSGRGRPGSSSGRALARGGRAGKASLGTGCVMQACDHA